MSHKIRIVKVYGEEDLSGYYYDVFRTDNYFFGRIFSYGPEWKLHIYNTLKQLTADELRTIADFIEDLNNA